MYHSVRSPAMKQASPFPQGRLQGVLAQISQIAASVVLGQVNYLPSSPLSHQTTIFAIIDLNFYSQKYWLPVYSESTDPQLNSKWYTFGFLLFCNVLAGQKRPAELLQPKIAEVSPRNPQLNPSDTQTTPGSLT